MIITENDPCKFKLMVVLFSILVTCCKVALNKKLANAPFLQNIKYVNRNYLNAKKLLKCLPSIIWNTSNYTLNRRARSPG